MKNKDNIRAAFDDWHFQKFGSTPSSGIDTWLYQKLQKQYSYEAGYDQARADLLSTLEPAAYQSLKKSTLIWTASNFRMLKLAQKNQEDWIVLYKLPEVEE